MDERTREVEAVVGRVSDQVMIAATGWSLNIHPVSVNRGSGLLWLAQLTGIDPAGMGGVGDTSSYIDFLRLVKNPAAPANATIEVKAMAHYVSAAGVHDILNHWQL